MFGAFFCKKSNSNCYNIKIIYIFTASILTQNVKEIKDYESNEMVREGIRMGDVSLLDVPSEQDMDRLLAV